MKPSHKIMLTVVLAFLLVGLCPSGAKALNCGVYYPGTKICIWREPELLPGAYWCGPNQIPGDREVIVYASTDWRSIPFPYCMVVPVRRHGVGGTQVWRLSSYGWDGPSFGIASIWFGAKAHGWVYPDDEETGVGTWFSNGGFMADTTGLSISSIAWGY